ncbi:hypothetical protein D3C87_1319100 [compost metagenome]
MILPDALHGIDRPAAHEAEIPRVHGDVHVGEPPQEAVEQGRRPLLEGRLSPPLGTDRVDHVVALAPLGHQLRDHFRRVLQVRIDDHDGLSGGVIHPRRDGGLMPEVA